MWKYSRSPCDPSSHQNLDPDEACGGGIAVLVEDFVASGFDGTERPAARAFDVASWSHEGSVGSTCDRAWSPVDGTAAAPWLVAGSARDGGSLLVESRAAFDDPTVYGVECTRDRFGGFASRWWVREAAEATWASTTNAILAAPVADDPRVVPGFCDASPGWMDDQRLAALRAASNHLVGPLARTAHVFLKRSEWVPLGYVRDADFALEWLGRCGRWLRDMASLGERLDVLPGLDAALCGQDGGPPLPRVAAQIVARVATPESVTAWIARAREGTIRDLRGATREARAHGSSYPIDCARPNSESCQADRSEHGSCRAADAEHGSCRPAHANAEQGSCRPARANGEHGSCRAEAKPEHGSSKATDEDVEHRSPTATDEDADDPAAAMQLVRFLVREPVMVAFEEVLDLHRSVSGYDASVGSFVEALVAEASAGLHPPDVSVEPLQQGTPSATIENALARANDNWRRLKDASSWNGDSADVFHLSGPRTAVAAGIASRTLDDRRTALDDLVETTLRRAARLAARAGQGNARELADQLVAGVELEDEIERCIGALLREMSARGDWTSLGFASAGHYAEERLGMARRTAESRIGIGRALRDLPLVRAAYESGVVGHEAAWLVRRALGKGPVAEQIEVAWVEHATDLAIKRLRYDLRRVQLEAFAALEISQEQLNGEGPMTATGLSAEVPTSALVAGGARRRACAPPPMPPTDAESHASLLRAPGMSRARVLRLGRLALDPRNADVFLRLRLPLDLAQAFLSAIESARRRLEARAHEVSWTESWPDPAAPSMLAAREFAVRCRRVPSWAGLLNLLEDYVQTWDEPRAIPKRRWVATYERDGYRCMMPGCSGRVVHDHHVVYRSHRGSNDLWNQIALCPAHHQQGEHGEFARVRGKAPLDLVFRLGKREFATWWKNERRLDRRRREPD